MLFSFANLGEKHISWPCQHPHLQHHGPAVCGAVVPGDTVQCLGQKWRCWEYQSDQRLTTYQVSLPDNEHPPDGAVQGVCRVHYQQLPNTVCSSGAAVECEKQRGGGVCSGAHPSKHREDKGKHGVKCYFSMNHCCLCLSALSMICRFVSLQYVLL